MIIKKVAGGAAEWEALRQMSPTFLSPFQQVSFFFFVVLNVFRFFYLNNSFFRIFWIYFNRYLSINIIDIIWYFGPTIIGITKTITRWPLSKSGDWCAHYVDWVFVGPAQLSTPPPSSGLAPSATNKGRSCISWLRKRKMWILVIFWERTNLFLPEASSSSYNLKWLILNKTHHWKKISAEKLGFAWI